MPNRLFSVLLLTVLVPQVACEAAPRGSHKGYEPLDDQSYYRAQSDYHAVWHDFKSTTEALLKTIGATNVEASALLTQVQTNAGFLSAKWEAWFRKHPTSATYAAGDDYLESLRGDLRLFHQVKKPKVSEEPLDILREVALDLQLKGDN